MLGQVAEFNDVSQPGETQNENNSRTAFKVSMPQWADSEKGSSKPGSMYKLDSHVVMRSEVLPDSKIFKIFQFIYVSLGLCTAILLCLAIAKAEHILESLEAARVYSGFNLAAAAGCTVSMVSCSTCYVLRVISVTRRGFSWSPRRKKNAVLGIAVCIAQTLNSIFYLLPNVLYAIDPTLSNYEVMIWMVFIRFSMWNTVFFLFVLKSKMLHPWLDSRNVGIGREDALKLDEPWKNHWLLYSFWCIGELILFVSLPVYLSSRENSVVTLDLRGKGSMCRIPMNATIASINVSCVIVFYHLLGLGYIYRGYQLLIRKPYALYRTTNIAIRFHFLNAGSVGDFVTFSLVLLFWLTHQSCASAYLSLLGFLPAQIIMTVLATVNCILAMPVKPGREVSLKKNPNRLAWQLSDLEKDDEDQDSTISKFCFELAVKLWYWSLATYAYDSQTHKCYDPKYLLMSFDVAMLIFELKEHECLEEMDCDTSVLIAWNQQTILLSFRGTYSAPNVLTDLQFWRVVHPPKRGTYAMRSQPLVHRGFLSCWRRNGFNHRVVNRVIQIMHSGGFDKSRIQIYVTGHSLGGALAVLAAYDLAIYCGLGRHITCYTYGTPRVGNHAFARDFNSRVPTTWLVINDEDIVPRVPKFLVLFKHVGEKVIINSKGDIIVCPFAIELSLYRLFTFFKRSLQISQHVLLSYRDSFVAICEAQYMKGKSLEGGMEAMNILLQERDRLLSECLAIEINMLRKLHRLGSSIWTKGHAEQQRLQAQGSIQFQ